MVVRYFLKFALDVYAKRKKFRETWSFSAKNSFRVFQYLFKFALDVYGEQKILH